MEDKLALIALALFLMLIAGILKEFHKIFTNNKESLNPKYMNDQNSTWETAVELDRENNVIIKSYQRYYDSRYIGR